MSEKSFGEQFHEWRELHGLSRLRIHEEADTSTSQLHYIENDDTLPSAEKLEQIGEAFGLDVSDLIRYRNVEFFSRYGLDGVVAVELLALGELSDEERQQLIDALKQVLNQRNR
ncbi:MAG: helix-turn-helix domain-containing protein [bacterium]|nr:helix-turn-helix domain-containing protein [bacterium]MDZ4248282.1 helix-turn-helix domain-containing protein [Patescibacteria group bacterium]